MTKERQEQVDILATKLMGWEKIPFPEDTDSTCSWAWYDDRYARASAHWNPFTSPADCEMLKAKINEKAHIDITRWVDGSARCNLYAPGHHGCHIHGKTEYEAVCLAALQLPECEE